VNDESALLAAILAAPEDDAPRLVFADWLDEHGNATWADLIRVQIGVARDPSAALRQRLKDLWSGRGGWAPPDSFRIGGAPAVKRSHLGRVEWIDAETREPFLAATVERGFVSAVECSLAAFLEHAEDVVTRLPVTAVELTDADPFSEPDFLGDPDDDESVRRPSSPRGRSPLQWIEWEGDRLADRQPWDVPDSVYDYLSDEGRDAGYESVEEAMADLGQACIEWARSEAEYWRGR
jgi:uncharacterized protein (TIGR02996 family)